jgi:hypothetical protein
MVRCSPEVKQKTDCKRITATDCIVKWNFIKKNSNPIAIVLIWIGTCLQQNSGEMQRSLLNGQKERSAPTTITHITID